jgi:hypothetical protein
MMRAFRAGRRAGMAMTRPTYVFVEIVPDPIVLAQAATCITQIM